MQTDRRFSLIWDANLFVCPVGSMKTNSNTSWHSHVSVGSLESSLDRGQCQFKCVFVCACGSIFVAHHVYVTHLVYPVLVAFGSLYTLWPHVEVYFCCLIMATVATWGLLCGETGHLRNPHICLRAFYFFFGMSGHNVCFSTHVSIAEKRNCLVRECVKCCRHASPSLWYAMCKKWVTACLRLAACGLNIWTIWDALHSIEPVHH